MKILGFIFTLFLTDIAVAQEDIKQYVSQNAVVVRSVDPINVDYSDLESLKDAIGGAKIVMLGEQDHGDGTAFLAKTRIIKFLHEKMGFNVLAFESDFFGLTEGWESARSEGNTRKLILRSVYPLWTYCQQVSNLLFDYIPSEAKTSHPLILAGIDNQVGSHIPYRSLDSFINDLKLPITNENKYKDSIWPLILQWSKNLNDASVIDKINGYLRVIKEQLIAKVGIDNFYVILTDNMIAQNAELSSIKRDFWIGENTRDEQMARNIKWLSQVKFADQKIIIWAHNLHVSKYGGHYPEVFLNNVKSMGSYLTQDKKLEEITYIMGFTSLTGNSGRLNGKKYELPTLNKESLENWIDKSYEYAFLDFRKFNTMSSQNSPFYMAGSIRPQRYHNSESGNWNRVYDGIFYLKKMDACILTKE